MRLTAPQTVIRDRIYTEINSVHVDLNSKEVQRRTLVQQRKVEELSRIHPDVAKLVSKGSSYYLTDAISNAFPELGLREKYLQTDYYLRTDIENAIRECTRNGVKIGNLEVEVKKKLATKYIKEEANDTTGGHTQQLQTLTGVQVEEL